MSENWKIQVSPKLTDGTLINLRAETPDEAALILDWAIENAGKIGEAVQAVNAVSVFAGAFPGTQVTVQSGPAPQAPPVEQPQQGGWNTPAQTPPPQWAAPQQQAAAPQGDQEFAQQYCAHGAMQLRRAKPESGKKWVAFFCPTKQGTPGQCKPVDAKTGKSWD